MADNKAFDIQLSGYAGLVSIDVSNGKAALFFVTYNSATIVAVADPDSSWVITNIDSAKMAIYKSATSSVFTIKNYTNGAVDVRVNILGQVTDASVPA
jgi:hypothetical protein